MEGVTLESLRTPEGAERAKEIFARNERILFPLLRWGRNRAGQGTDTKQPPLTGKRLSWSCFNAGIADTVDEGMFVMLASYEGLAYGLYAATIGKYKCLRPLLAILAHNQGLCDIEEEARQRISKLEAAAR